MSGAPLLHAPPAATGTVPDCALCGGPRRLSHRATLLGRHDVAYHFCDGCGLLQTETPHWLDEAYASVIADSDTGLVMRNIGLAARLGPLLSALFGPDARFVDAGGGYGMLTRLMRDVGFDFYWSDPYCQNLFARGFEADAAGGRFDAVTAFEVMEHVHDPLGFVRSVLERYDSRTFVFSTQLFEGAPPPRGEWTYYSVETGQHVSFYQRRTLDRLAAELGLTAHSSGFFHVLTDRPLHPLRFRLTVGRAGLAALPFIRWRRGSRTVPDRDRALDTLRAAAASREGTAGR